MGLYSLKALLRIQLLKIILRLIKEVRILVAGPHNYTRSIAVIFNFDSYSKLTVENFRPVFINYQFIDLEFDTVVLFQLR